eukprot:TRINITY_DN15635_c0_g1_i1.p1 TRINITY_DN15635_c0_g1~~TRINITY_DN15635_c0_g1_i1.p1  ORF type:complete len:123 (-),score=35.16 TRINITY_DN15635_c0_g1_i1:59-427(-)
MLLYGWIAAYCLNFTLNFITPAVSPRLWLQHYYHTPLEGVLLGKVFQSAIKSVAGGNAYDPKSFGAFPSGHVGMTWLAAIAAGALGFKPVSYTHLRAHETVLDLVCRLLLEKKKKIKQIHYI